MEMMMEGKQEENGKLLFFVREAGKGWFDWLTP